MSVATLRWTSAVSRARWVAVPLTAAVVSRLFSALLLLREANSAGRLPELVHDGSPFMSWDSQWYMHIADFGYHAIAVQPPGAIDGHHDFAFFPGWPLVIRIISLDGALPMHGLAVVAANLFFVLAAITAYQLFAERFSERTALWGTLLLCFNPAAYVFSMAYSEALFVLLAALYFLDRYGRLSPLWAGLSMLVRISGLAIGASAAAMFVLGGAPRRRLLVICGAVAIAFGAWWIYIWQLTGNFYGWMEGSPAWLPKQGIDGITTEFAKQPTWEIGWIGFVALLIVGSLLMIRRHPDMAVYGLVAIAMSLIGAPPSSMARHAMVAFPAFAALADRLGPRLSAVLLIVFALAQIVFINLSFGTTRQPP